MNCQDKLRQTSQRTCVNSLAFSRRLWKTASVGTNALLCLALLGSAACAGRNTQTMAPNKNSSNLSVVPASPPNEWPNALFDSLGYILSRPGDPAKYVRGVIGVRFIEGASHADRVAAIRSVDGTVVGGHKYSEDGDYYVRILGRTLDSMDHAVQILRSRRVVQVAYPLATDPSAGIDLRGSKPPRSNRK